MLLQGCQLSQCAVSKSTSTLQFWVVTSIFQRGMLTLDQSSRFAPKDTACTGQTTPSQVDPERGVTARSVNTGKPERTEDQITQLLGTMRSTAVHFDPLWRSTASSKASILCGMYSLFRGLQQVRVVDLQILHLHCHPCMSLRASQYTHILWGG